MQLKVLGKPASQPYPHYRGTDRSEPYYQDNLPPDHPVNLAFLWYVSHELDAWVVTDLPALRSLIRLYGQLTPPQDFELVEITDALEKPLYGTELLGSDVSNVKRLSLLPWGVDFDAVLKADEHVKRLIPLVELMSLYFKAKLNESELFNDIETAQLLLDCVEVLQSIERNLWENNENKFEVVLVWSVEP